MNGIVSENQVKQQKGQKTAAPAPATNGNQKKATKLADMSLKQLNSFLFD